MFCCEWCFVRFFFFDCGFDKGGQKDRWDHNRNGEIFKEGRYRDFIYILVVYRCVFEGLLFMEHG